MTGQRGENGTGRLLITAGRLWDGTDRPPVADGAVVIVGDRIAAAGSSRDIGPQGQGVTTLAFPGATLLPGFIDTHVHLVWPGDGTAAWTYTEASTDSGLLLRAAQNARLALCAGVTTLRDVGSRGTVALDLRDAVNAGLMTGPRIVGSGPPITIRGGHMHYLGGEADTADEIRVRIRAGWRMGIDFVKLVANGGGTPRTHSWIPAYSQDEIDAAIAEAHNHETYLTAHANATESIRRLVQAGADGIEHCTFLEGPGRVVFDEALAEEIARKGIHVGHTLQAAYRSIERARARWDTLSADEQAQIDLRRRTWEAQCADCGRLLRMGVKLVASTDAGWSLNPFGEYWLALELFVRSGATAVQALASGTRVAAEALRMGDKVGTVQPGKLADLVVVDGDPTENILDVRRVRAVVRSGRVVA